MNIFRSARSGYSLMEIVIVISIISVMAIGVMTLYRRVQDSMKTKENRELIAQVRMGIDRYKADMGVVPSRLSDLIKRPADVQGKPSSRWQGDYIHPDYADFIDAYGNPLVYKALSAREYDLHSESSQNDG